jgi:hypothetical protein
MYTDPDEENWYYDEGTGCWISNESGRSVPHGWFVIDNPEAGHLLQYELDRRRKEYGTGPRGVAYYKQWKDQGK